MSKYATKTDLKNATGIDTSFLAKKVDLASLKFDVDNLDIDKLKSLPTNVNNLKSKIDKLNVDKLLPVPVALSKLSAVVKKDVIKKDVCNVKIRNFEDKTPDVTNLATKTNLNAKINEIKGETSSITNLATKTVANGVENKIPSISKLVKKN